jgi:hypothetical protein
VIQDTRFSCERIPQPHHVVRTRRRQVNAVGRPTDASHVLRGGRSGSLYVQGGSLCGGPDGQRAILAACGQSRTVGRPSLVCRPKSVVCCTSLDPAGHVPYLEHAGNTSRSRGPIQAVGRPRDLWIVTRQGPQAVADALGGEVPDLDA